MTTAISMDSCDLSVYEDSFSLICHEKSDASGNRSEFNRHDFGDSFEVKCDGSDDDNDNESCKLVELTSFSRSMKPVHCENNSIPLEINLEVIDGPTVFALIRVKISGPEGNYKFHCTECTSTFPCRLSVISHMASHTGFKPFHCVSCDSLSSCEEEARLHYKAHSRDETLLVDVNQIPGSTKEISDELGKGNFHICAQCQMTFKCAESLSCHMKVHVSLGEHICLHCREDFCSFTLLKSHEKSCHSNSMETLVLEKNLTIRTNEGKVESKWICQTCEKAFRSSRALREHEVVHTGARDFPCKVCGKAFGTATNMRIHLLTHSDQRPFACQTCGATFRQKDSLKVHERKHTGERPFVCSVCQMAFDRNFTLKNHMLKHAEKSFVCSVCGKAFSTRGGLINHERLHFKEPQIKKQGRQARAKSGTGNWICDECGKIYSTRSNLKIHQKSHEPTQICHVCPVCSQSYKSRDSMEVHMRRHTEERPFKCTMCSRSFYRNYTLKIHILTHTGEKPHSCPIEGCKKSFAQTSSLSYHIRNHKKREECNLNQNNGKRSYRKRKTVQDNFFNEDADIFSVNIRSSPMRSDKTSCSSSNNVSQDLKLGVGALMPLSITSSNVALSNTPDNDTAVQSMLDDISHSMAHQMDHALPAVWDDGESIAMLGVVNGLHSSSQHATLANLNAVSMDLQQHCQQVPLMHYAPTETLPLLVGTPDSHPGGVLYQPDNVHKVLSGSMSIPHLP